MDFRLFPLRQCLLTSAFHLRVSPALALALTLALALALISTFLPLLAPLPKTLLPLPL